MPRMNRTDFIDRVRSEYHYTVGQAQKLWELAEECAPFATTIGGTTGAVAAVGGGTVSVGGLAVPAWAVGFLGGFIAGEIACVAGNGQVQTALDEILRRVD